MATHNVLHTAHDKHAISEAILSFIITPQIVNASSYGELLKDERPLSKSFHKYELIKSKEITLKGKLNETSYESRDIDEAGFKLISFKDGKVSNVIQGLSQQGRALLTFNTTDYESWDIFVTKAIKDAKEIANFHPIYKVKALGLMYIDEFYFDNSQDYNPRILFNVDSSRNLPKGFEDSDFVNLNYILHRNKENRKYHDNVSINVFDKKDKKTIRITENLTYDINETPMIEFLEDSDLRESLNFLHEENKNTLRDILSSKIKKNINL